MYSARCSRTRTRRLMYGLLSSGFKNQERSEVVLRRALPGSRFHHGSLNLLSLAKPGGIACELGHVEHQKRPFSSRGRPVDEAERLSEAQQKDRRRLGVDHSTNRLHRRGSSGLPGGQQLDSCIWLRSGWYHSRSPELHTVTEFFLGRLANQSEARGLSSCRTATCSFIQPDVQFAWTD